MNHSIKEQKVFIDGAVSIGATVSYMDDNKVSPVVILIAGTGKMDRDGNEYSFSIRRKWSSSNNIRNKCCCYWRREYPKSKTINKGVWQTTK